MKTIIAGGRDFKPTEAHFRYLDDCRDALPITEVVSGGAKGADEFGEAWAASRGVPVERFPADWAAYGKAAGPMRNAEMAAYADALIAFPGGRGTASMINLARIGGLHVVEVGG